MNDTIYTLLNEMDHQADAYGNFEASPEEVKNWKKAVLGTAGKPARRWPKYAAAAACACLLVSATPAGQTVYAQVNAMMHSLSELLGISKDLSPYSTVIGESISKDAFTVTLNDVILDDETLLVSYTTTSSALSEEDSEINCPELAGVFIDGRQMAFGSSGSIEKLDKYTSVSCMEVEIPDIDPEKQIDMELQFDLNGAKMGSFAFTASGKELLADTAAIELDRTFTLPDQSSVTLTKYTSSDVNQKIYFEASMDGYTYDLMLKGTDDLGNDVEFTVRSYKDGAGRMEVSTIHNGYINDNAKELNLTLYAVKMPEESGKMSTDYEEMGEPFTVRLNTEN